MLTYNTMRFATDEFSFVGKRALLIAKDPIALAANFNIINKFVIDYQQPAGSSIRFAFWAPYQDKKNVFKFSGGSSSQDQLISIVVSNDTEEILETVLEAGHTVDYLLAINDLISSFNMYPVIALEGSEDAIPKVKFGVQVSKREPVLSLTATMNYTFDKPSEIREVSLSPTITGDAAFDSEYAYRLDSADDFSEYMEASELAGKVAKEVKFKYTRTVTEVDGDDSITLGRLTFNTTEDIGSIVFGDTADLYTYTKNYYLPLRYCAVIVKHEELNGASIKAFAKFDPGRYSAINRNIGSGTGSSQTITLATAKYFRPSSLHVFVDGVETTAFEFSTQDNSITINAPEGAVITASYVYNAKAETWIELAADPVQHDFSDGLFVTRYHCDDVKQYGDNVMVSAIRLQFIRGTNGNVPRVHSFTAGWATKGGVSNG